MVFLLQSSTSIKFSFYYPRNSLTLTPGNEIGEGGSEATDEEIPEKRTVNVRDSLPEWREHAHPKKKPDLRQAISRRMRISGWKLFPKLDKSQICERDREVDWNNAKQIEILIQTSSSCREDFESFFSFFPLLMLICISSQRSFCCFPLANSA